MGDDTVLLVGGHGELHVIAGNDAGREMMAHGLQRMSKQQQLAVRVGAYAVCTREAGDSLEILLARCGPDSRFVGEWALPGGGIEWGEHPRDTLVREMAEETSLMGAPGRFLAAYAQHVDAKGKFPKGVAMGLLFATRAADGDPKLGEDEGTTDEVAWHPMNDLPTLAWNSKVAVELVNDGARSQAPTEDIPGPRLGIPHRPRSSRRRLGAYAIATNHDAEVPRILLTRLAPDDPEAGCWNLPGGGVEPGESPLEALTREFHEETGLAPTSVAPHEVDSRVYEAWGSKQIKHSVGVIYRATARGNPEVLETDGSTEEAAWFPVDQLGEVQLSQLARATLAHHTF